jgi:hypothetical protein
MKRATGIALLLLLYAAGLLAEVYPALTPKDATSMALGGSFTSIPTAQFSFFGNPAAFAAPKASLTLISTDAWAYIKPTSSNISSFFNAIKNANLSAIAALMPSDGGIGGGASVGLGYAGKGLGLGVFATTDEYAAGDSIPGAVLNSDTEVSAVIGLGLPIKFLGTTLSLGGDLRPFYRVRADTPLADILDSITSSGGSGTLLDSLRVNAGFGLAMDLGASLQLGSFGIGLSVRDIAPSFPIATPTAQELLDSLKSGSLPDTSASTAKAVFVPNVTAGMSWKPRLIPGLIDPAMYLELQDPVSVVQNWEGIGSALNLLHAGAELKLLNFITLRGGINRGWLSAGAGLKFLFLDLNAAVFTEELGALPGDEPRSGLAIQAAIRF